MKPKDSKVFCTESGKECFDRRSQAERVMYNHKARRHTQNAGSVYLCPACGKYHVTHYSFAKSKDMATSKRKKIDLGIIEDY